MIKVGGLEPLGPIGVYAYGHYIALHFKHMSVGVCVCVQTEIVSADLYPPTAGTQPALSADDWLAGNDRSPILVPIIVSLPLLIMHS